MTWFRHNYYDFVDNMTSIKFNENIQSVLSFWDLFADLKKTKIQILTYRIQISCLNSRIFISKLTISNCGTENIQICSKKWFHYLNSMLQPQNSNEINSLVSCCTPFLIAVSILLMFPNPRACNSTKKEKWKLWEKKSFQFKYQGCSWKIFGMWYGDIQKWRSQKSRFSNFLPYLWHKIFIQKDFI